MQVSQIPKPQFAGFLEDPEKDLGGQECVSQRGMPIVGRNIEVFAKGIEGILAPQVDPAEAPGFRNRQKCFHGVNGDIFQALVEMLPASHIEQGQVVLDMVTDDNPVLQPIKETAEGLRLHHPLRGRLPGDPMDRYRGSVVGHRHDH